MENNYTYKELSNDILIQSQPLYLPERSIPEQDHYFYAYKVKITNLGQSDCKLLHRRWVIKNGKGIQRQVQGLGVVGSQPIIKPNENFSYTSYCPLDTETGNMRGTFIFHNDEGEFSVNVPLIFFRRN